MSKSEKRLDMVWELLKGSSRRKKPSYDEIFKEWQAAKKSRPNLLLAFKIKSQEDIKKNAKKT